MTKGTRGRFFEDFDLGEEIFHATPRTLTHGDAAVYLALTGSRFAHHSADGTATRLGLPRAPLDDLLTFNVVFGRSVPDVSLNAIANLGYADGRFDALVYPGDTLRASSTVIGLKENSNRRTGIVYVRTRALRDDNRPVLDYVRWVMVRKRDPASPAPEPVVPDLPDHVTPGHLRVPPGLRPRDWDVTISGSPHLFDDYAIGERIDHVDGMTIDEAGHRLATRLYQNTARVHFNDHTQRSGQFGRCIVYGGHVLSLARTLSFNGLGNLVHIVAINAGHHVNPCFAGDTVYAWSEVLDMVEPDDRDDVGLMRLRLVATRDRPCGDFPLRGTDGTYDSDVLLDFDYWGVMPRSPGRG